ncbi:MAG TPA: helix-turn-helix domain-containing protein [Acidimicrobiales bacterium]|nr:helix-turn-helix domain-containing protein [Acidimicrobiales bacterium]
MPIGSDRLKSGIADLDELLGGLILGDNVVWVVDGPEVIRRLEDALLREAVRRGQRSCYVAVSTPPERVRERLQPAVTVLDARARGSLGDPAALEMAILDAARDTPPGCVVVDSLDRLARRWGAQRAVGFFSRVCPQLFDLGALAYWRASRKELGSASVERITQVTQCVLEVADGHLRVVKAEGRPASVQGRILQLRTSDGSVELSDERALGRLGRGLERLRQERNLTQSDLARLLDVTPSAISQAEGGRRGLSLDTVILLSERLGVSLDELLSTAPESGYVLARRPRAPTPTVTALLDDPKAGLRAYLVRLGPSESGAPDIIHKGAELVLVASGLVQVTIGSDTPVMRAGDSLLATRVAVSAWRNLTSEPAWLFRVLRD